MTKEEAMRLVLEIRRGEYMGPLMYNFALSKEHAAIMILRAVRDIFIREAEIDALEEEYLKKSPRKNKNA